LGVCVQFVRTSRFGTTCSVELYAVCYLVIIASNLTKLPLMRSSAELPSAIWRASLSSVLGSSSVYPIYSSYRSWTSIVSRVGLSVAVVVVARIRLRRFGAAESKVHDVILFNGLCETLRREYFPVAAVSTVSSALIKNRLQASSACRIVAFRITFGVFGDIVPSSNSGCEMRPARASFQSRGGRLSTRSCRGVLVIVVWTRFYVERRFSILEI
jgi:hypothetical protein